MSTLPETINPENINWVEAIKLWIDQVTLEQAEVIIDPLSNFQGLRKLQKDLKRR